MTIDANSFRDLLRLAMLLQHRSGRNS